MAKKVGKLLDSYNFHNTVNLPAVESVHFKTGFSLLTRLLCQPGRCVLLSSHINIYNMAWKAFRIKGHNVSLHVTLRRVRVNIVAVEKQEVLHILRAC
jgi:hypothetical protein